MNKWKHVKQVFLKQHMKKKKNQMILSDMFGKLN